MRFRPPGNLTDVADDRGSGAKWHEEWHDYIQARVGDATAALEKPTAENAQDRRRPQFYDPNSGEDVGPTIEHDVVWNAFPRELLRRFGREEALRVADTLWPLPAHQLGWRYVPGEALKSDVELRSILAAEPFARDCLYRPQTEYCEWHVQRNQAGRVQRVTFTCEPPEYWMAMCGGPLIGGAEFADHRTIAFDLYRRHVDRGVIDAELVAASTITATPLAATLRGGDYNPYNRWNSLSGIAHLSAPPNALHAEILLAAQATRLYENARGEPVVLPEVLCAGAARRDESAIGNGSRNSDVAIVAAANALARQGRRITLADPVGVYMGRIDLSGWSFPGGFNAEDCLRYRRGVEGAALRVVIEVPDLRFDVSDICIAGVPILYGGQIAECITVKLPVLATVAAGIVNRREALTRRSYVHPDRPGELFPGPKLDTPEGSVQAFTHETDALPAVPRTREALGEPLLEMDQIQGLSIPGFLKPHQTLLCLRHGRSEADLRKIRALLSKLLPMVATGRVALADRDRFRRRESNSYPLVGIAFTWPGLCSLQADAQGMSSPAFRKGLAERSALLGDPTEPGMPGHPSTWLLGGRAADTPDFMIVVAGDHREAVDREVKKLLKLIRPANCKWTRQDGDKLDPSGKSREHFGFVDGISQPGIRGRWTVDPDCFLTPSRIAEYPASCLYGHPGQELVWPGEFVLGYPKSGPDPLFAGPIAEPELPWMRNGSYLVYSRLLQDVGGFWKTMREEARRLSSEDGFDELSAEGLASRLVGRTRNGVPLSRVRGPERAFHEGLGSNPFANNNFRFDSDTPSLSAATGSDSYPMARADPLGMVCPLAAHIRKVHPRDAASDVGGESANYQHRILRAGVAFGPRRAKLKSDPVEGEPERGALFLCIQASIEEQFEFLQARWMNDGVRPRSSGGHDMLVGRTGSVGDGSRRCTIIGADGQKQDVSTRVRFVTSSGGAYFFVPSLDAIRMLSQFSDVP